MKKNIITKMCCILSVLNFFPDMINATQSRAVPGLLDIKKTAREKISIMESLFGSFKSKVFGERNVIDISYSSLKNFARHLKFKNKKLKKEVRDLCEDKLSGQELTPAVIYKYAMDNVFDTKKLNPEQIELLSGAFSELLQRKEGRERILSIILLNLIIDEAGVFNGNSRKKKIKHADSGGALISSSLLRKSSGDVEYQLGDYKDSVKLDLSKRQKDRASCFSYRKDGGTSALKPYQYIATVLYHECSHLYHSQLFGLLRTFNNGFKQAIEDDKFFRNKLYPTLDPDFFSFFAKKIICEKLCEKIPVSDVTDEVISSLYGRLKDSLESDSAKELIPADNLFKIYDKCDGSNMEKLSMLLLIEMIARNDHWMDTEELITICGVIPINMGKNRYIICDQQNDASLHSSWFGSFLIGHQSFFQSAVWTGDLMEYKTVNPEIFMKTPIKTGATIGTAINTELIQTLGKNLNLEYLQMVRTLKPDCRAEFEIESIEDQKKSEDSDSDSSSGSFLRIPRTLDKRKQKLNRIINDRRNIVYKKNYIQHLIEYAEESHNKLSLDELCDVASCKFDELAERMVPLTSKKIDGMIERLYDLTESISREGRLNLLRMLASHFNMTITSGSDAGDSVTIYALIGPSRKKITIHIDNAKLNFSKQNILHKVCDFRQEETKDGDFAVIQDLVDTIIKKSTDDMYVADIKNETPMHFAFRSRNASTIKSLVKKYGFKKIFDKNSDGKMPIDLVSKNTLGKILKELSELYSATADSEEILEYVCRNCDFSVMKKWISKKPGFLTKELETQTNSLREFCREGNFEKVKKCLDAEVDKSKVSYMIKSHKDKEFSALDYALRIDKDTFLSDIYKSTYYKFQTIQQLILSGNLQKKDISESIKMRSSDDDGILCNVKYDYSQYLYLNSEVRKMLITCFPLSSNTLWGACVSLDKELVESILKHSDDDTIKTLGEEITDIHASYNIINNILFGYPPPPPGEMSPVIIVDDIKERLGILTILFDNLLITRRDVETAIEKNDYKHPLSIKDSNGKGFLDYYDKNDGGSWAAYQAPAALCESDPGIDALLFGFEHKHYSIIEKCIEKLSGESMSAPIPTVKGGDATNCFEKLLEYAFCNIEQGLDLLMKVFHKFGATQVEGHFKKAISRYPRGVNMFFDFDRHSYRGKCGSVFEFAHETGNYEYTEMLLRLAPAWCGGLAFRFACQKGYARVVQDMIPELVKAKKESYVTDYQKGLTPLMLTLSDSELSKTPINKAQIIACLMKTGLIDKENFNFAIRCCEHFVPLLFKTTKEIDALIGDLHFAAGYRAGVVTPSVRVNVLGDSDENTGQLLNYLRIHFPDVFNYLIVSPIGEKIWNFATRKGDHMLAKIVSDNLYRAGIWRLSTLPTTSPTLPQAHPALPSITPVLATVHPALRPPTILFPASSTVQKIIDAFDQRNQVVMDIHISQLLLKNVLPNDFSKILSAAVHATDRRSAVAFLKKIFDKFGKAVEGNFIAAANSVDMRSFFDYKDDRKKSVFNYALEISTTSTDFVKMLLKLPPASSGKTALRFICQQGFATSIDGVIDKLILSGYENFITDMDEDGFTPLIYALSSQAYDIPANKAYIIGNLMKKGRISSNYLFNEISCCATFLRRNVLGSDDNQSQLLDELFKYCDHQSFSHFLSIANIHTITFASSKGYYESLEKIKNYNPMLFYKLVNSRDKTGLSPLDYALGIEAKGIVSQYDRAKTLSILAEVLSEDDFKESIKSYSKKMHVADLMNLLTYANSMNMLKLGRYLDVGLKEVRAFLSAPPPLPAVMIKS